MNNCKNCHDYKPATKTIIGHHGFTGTCLQRAYPFNKVADYGYCLEHEETKQSYPDLAPCEECWSRIMPGLVPALFS
jgi:hypothetical protein